VLKEGQLLQAVADAKAHGETIVMTNGCFDILHAGHVTYLEQAKRLGSRLIVAVNDDASVRRLKGADRPVNPLEQRMRVLAGLAAVDWVAPFYEDTPERLIGAVQPDYLVKGGDNDPAHIPGNRCVWDAGGQVVVMDYLEDCSTTRTIARILNRP
jgi:D-beta-D-heptose 7-phosphate kinase/D-beta-D-heptose 1-phosphate adenosyltransferase